MEPGLKGSYQSPETCIPGLIPHEGNRDNRAIEVYRGDDLVVALPLCDDNGPVDITGGTLYWTLNVQDELCPIPILQKTSADSSLIQTQPGLVTLTLESADTVHLMPGFYTYDFLLVDGAGKRRTISMNTAVVRARSQIQ